MVTGAFIEYFKTTKMIVKEFWKHNSRSYFDYLREYREFKLADGSIPFDINICRILALFLLGIIGSVIDGALASIVGLIRFIPGLCYLYYQFWMIYCKMDGVWICSCFIAFFLANILMPLVAVICYIVNILVAMYFGITCAMKGYEDGIWKGIK